MREREQTLAGWIVERGGWRSLYPCIDLVVLFAMASVDGTLSISEVCEYGVRTKWGSQAKFYRYLHDWRVVTQTDSPQLVVDRAKLDRDGKRALVQAMSLSAVQAGVA